MDGITPVLFKYPSHNKAFYFKASSTYFLLGPGIEHLFLRCFLSPNGKERTDCIPLRFGPSLQKRRLLVLHSEKGSSETVFSPLIPTTCPCKCCFALVCKLRICSDFKRNTLTVAHFHFLIRHNFKSDANTEVTPLFGRKQ